MKKITFYCFSLLLLLVTSCSKPNPTEEVDDLYKNSPRSEVPAELAPGTWVWGGFSPLSHYERGGRELGRDWEAARNYDVTKDGFIEFGQYLGTRSGRCVTEHYSRLKGTIQFQGNKFTFYPVEGSFKTIKRECTSGNTTTERPAVAADLKPTIYLWKVVNSTNSNMLYVYQETDVNMESPVFVYTVKK